MAVYLIPWIEARMSGMSGELLFPFSMVLGTALHGGDSTKHGLNVKSRLFCVFCIISTKQAERAHWRSSRAYLPALVLVKKLRPWVLLIMPI